MCRASCSQCNHGYCPTGAEVRCSQNVTHSNVIFHVMKIAYSPKEIFFSNFNKHFSLHFVGPVAKPFLFCDHLRGQLLCHAVCGHFLRGLTLPRIAPSPGKHHNPRKAVSSGTWV